MPTESSRHRVAMPSGPDFATCQPAHRHRLVLMGDIQRFAQALAAPTRDGGWRSRVSKRLVALRGAFAEHVVLTEGPDGLYTELLDEAPRLARGVHVLIREHGAVATAMSSLQRRVDTPETSTEEVRGWAGDLLRRLSRHRQRGADLVYEAYATDIGGET